MKRFRYYICIMLLAGMAVIGGCSAARKKLSISPYVLVDVKGLSTRAQATVYIDTEGIYNALAGIGASREERAVYDGFVASLSVNADKLEKLANGDAVNVTVTYDAQLAEELSLNVSDFIKTVEISGLNEGYEIDVFKDLEVIVTGTAPYAFVTYNNKSDDPYISKLEYVVESKTSGLKNGDVVTIRCMLDADTAELYYYYTDVTTMSYIVEGLDTYIYDSAELDSDVLCDIAQECAQVVYDDTNDTTTRMMYKLTGSSNYLYQDNNERVDALRLSRVIFLSRSNEGASPYENIILYVFEATIANHYFSENGYYIFEYTNAIRSGNGEFMIGRNDPHLRYICGQNYEELYSELIRDIEYQYSAVTLDSVTYEPDNDSVTE